MTRFSIFLITLIIILTVLSPVKAQDFDVDVSGFVKNDLFYDSRQTVSAREGHFLLWPAPEKLDINDDDINETMNYNILAVQSRVSLGLTGPDAFGAKTSGRIEGDFFAQSNININLFRLRHAFVKLDWGNTELLAGQTWNPMFITHNFPGTVSFNTGTPFQAFARNPQIKLTQNAGNIRFLIAALAQRDYASRGPDGATSKYLRNSGIPDMHFQVHYLSDMFKAGVGGAYKQIVPQLSNNGEKTDEAVPGLSFLGYVRFDFDNLAIKAEGLYGQNLPDVLQASGFAMKANTDKVEYLPLSRLSAWADIHSKGEDFQFGLFAGYSDNLGTSDEIVPGTLYGLGTNIASMMRVSPRVIFNSGSTRFAGELEYTRAAFGSPSSEDAIPENTTEVANLRLLFSIYYFF